LRAELKTTTNESGNTGWEKKGKKKRRKFEIVGPFGDFRE
jgi:hypothetical protein